MPFIDSKITVKMSDSQKEQLKSKLGRAISILHKPESFLMVGINDGYDLFMGGEKLDKGAFVSVSLLGNASSSDYDKMTGEICKIFEEIAQIPGQSVYVTYQGIGDWGWNGRNF